MFGETKVGREPVVEPAPGDADPFAEAFESVPPKAAEPPADDELGGLLLEEPPPPADLPSDANASVAKSTKRRI